MMSAHLRGAESPPRTQSQPPAQPHAQGIAQAFKDTNKDLLNTSLPPPPQEEEEMKVKLVLVNRAGESRSPYVRAHAKNPVAWQIWGDEALELAKRENRLLFLSIGYSACHCMSLPLVSKYGKSGREMRLIFWNRVSCYGTGEF